MLVVSCGGITACCGVHKMDRDNLLITQQATLKVVLGIPRRNSTDSIVPGLGVLELR